MIAVSIGPDIPMAIVGAPEYFRGQPAPTTPAQLIDHHAVNLRLPTSGTLNRWRLMKGGREARVGIEGPLAINNIDLIRDAALDGHGLTYLPLDQVSRDLDRGDLIHVLNRFTPNLPGYHLYYPHRRHASSAFALLVETLRFRG